MTKTIFITGGATGTIHTPLVDNLFDKFAQVKGKTIDDNWVQENALYARGKAGQPEEVAELVAH